MSASGRERYKTTIPDVPAAQVADVTARVNQVARDAGLDPETDYRPWPGRGPNPSATYWESVLVVTAWGTTEQLSAFCAALIGAGFPADPPVADQAIERWVNRPARSARE